MESLTRKCWVSAVVLGLTWAGRSALAADPAGPTFPNKPVVQNGSAKAGDRKSIWQITITPNCAPAVVADFYQEADGSLSVIHRPADGVTGPAQEQLAPPPAPAPEKPAAKTGEARAANSGLFFVADDPAADAEKLKKPEPMPEIVPGNGAAPAPGAAIAPPAPAPELATAGYAGTPAFGGPRMSYMEAYLSVPFFRSEYNANPSYRHEAAMEIMFGQLRPTVVHKYVPPPQVQRWDYNYITPYSYYLNGRGYNYNFYYPLPTVYRHY